MAPRDTGFSLPSRGIGEAAPKDARSRLRETRMPSLLQPTVTTRSAQPAVTLVPVYLRSTAGPSAAYLTAKRLLDVFASLALLTLLSPLFLIVALCVKLTDGGPVFFRQKRVGLQGRVFDFFKFRSMVVDAEARKAELLKLNK